MKTCNLLRRAQLVTLAIAVVTMSLVACVKTPDGGTPAPATSTEWKEGYGGDSIAIAAAQMIDSTCFQARPLRNIFLKRALETDKDVADEICGLLKSGGLVIESIDQPKIDGVNKDAANYPNAKPRRLQIKKSFWTDPATTNEAREKILMHEVFPLIGLPDKDLVRSTRFRIALEARRGHLSESNSCDKDEINAILAGMNSDVARNEGRRLGQARCRAIIEMFADSADYRTFDDRMTAELTQSFGYGLLIAHARTVETREMKEIEILMREAAVAMPAIFHAWAPEHCAAMSPPQSRFQFCGSTLELMAGASPYQKLEVIGPAGHVVDFDRASVRLLMAAFLSEEGYPNLERLPKQKIPSEIIEASIRAQNWIQLLILGQIQRQMTPEKRSSDVLLGHIRWEQMHREASFMIEDNLDLLNQGEFMLCDPYFLPFEAHRTIDGVVSGHMCRQNTAI